MKRFDSMNVVPLIDVMLVLLAIVLLTASFIVHDKLDIQLPKTEHTSAYNPDNDEKLNISIDQYGQFYWDGIEINAEEFDKQLSQLEASTHIQLRVDQLVEFHHFVRLMDIIKRQQHDNLTILTERK
ncbi:MAG: biopolymer transporter ExbD [Thiomicrospira sp.]|uniref:ExbD/TolR family protein n=1 Tax=Thiomicrospira sp. TaxID=935 RepID=UPI001A0D8417|nr:biopolymer transporter ExbD [Thiomicrospira sp.]MBE0494255.1 biopolymer transporter ExbD [Thiomicrospira sp.]